MMPEWLAPLVVVGGSAAAAGAVWLVCRLGQREMRRTIRSTRYGPIRCRRCTCGVLLFGATTMSHLMYPPHPKSEIEWALRYGAVMQRDETGLWRQVVPAGAAAEGVPV